MVTRSKRGSGRSSARSYVNKNVTCNGWSKADCERFNRLDVIEKRQASLKQTGNVSEYEKLEKEKAKLAGYPYRSPFRRAYKETARQIIP